MVGLDLDEVRAHVGRWAASQPQHRAQDLGQAAVRAAIDVHAARHRLALALDTQQAIDEIRSLMIGRSQGPAPRDTGEPDAITPLDTCRAGFAQEVNAAVMAWRRAGQAFSRAARLLPTQLSSALPVPQPQSHPGSDAIACRRLHAQWQQAREIHRAALEVARGVGLASVVRPRSLQARAETRLDAYQTGCRLIEAERAWLLAAFGGDPGMH